MEIRSENPEELLYADFSLLISKSFWRLKGIWEAWTGALESKKTESKC